MHICCKHLASELGRNRDIDGYLTLNTLQIKVKVVAIFSTCILVLTRAATPVEHVHIRLKLIHCLKHLKES